MIRRLVLLVVFLLAGLKPVYADTLSVDVYGSYNFAAKGLTIFWKTPTTTYSSYKLILSKITVTATCGSPILTGLKTYTTNAYNTTFTNLPPDYYRVDIKGITSTGEALVYSKDFFIALTSPKFEISWCNGTSADNASITDTVVYTNVVPSFEFTNNVSVPDYKTMKLSKTTNYYDSLNMVFVNKVGTGQSGPSGQVIVYTVLPDKPTWQGIKAN